MISTRRSGRGGTEPDVSFTTAIQRGLAPDGGLYLPTALPDVTALTLGKLREVAVDAPGSPEALALTARHILAPFLDDPADSVLRERLPELCLHAFEAPTPLRDLDDRTALLELHHGPTAAFKDMAARFLAGALSAVGMRGHVLVATSGDTGSAVAAAFEGREGFQVSVLFPAHGVSARQAHLLSCFGNGGTDDADGGGGGGGGNVRSYRVRGTFDDAQAMVKAALSDPELVRAHGLTSANSISLGRLVPQLTWFANAALAWEARSGEAPGFIVPSGNFGHGLAALWARHMGFPVGPIHLATNRNRALVDWFETGRAEPRSSVRTPANAMDVGVPSNLERLRFQVRSDPVFASDVTASSVDDEKILEATGAAPGRWGVTVCPHTACALHVLEAFRARGDRRPWIVAATAHPAKFPEVVEPRIGREVPLPPALERLLARPARASPLAAEVGALRDAFRDALRDG